ncbi:amino acid adenylation domain-containing protein [Kibdelosporangium philippinense]|uniref:Phenyloxazoline synthase MbtB n=1 Tax=Kibdelosporangium philippinense TaxID=211113 RepID=A0ABS8Z6T4_9PSEU|nr:non-ribosomal peptide synthetase [Kibdelosporangium philippinense]MCE7003591.1 amino acid adenylation domain-containing protein [Kibdelosporangium philippinense]
MSQQPTAAQLLRDVTDLLGPEAAGLSDDDSLIEWGLDSIQLMQVANQWRRNGVKVPFALLAKNPTLAGWRKILADAGVAPEPAVTVEVDESAPFPLALMQHAYWIGRDEEATLGSVAAHLYVEFDGPDLDPVRLATAVRKLVARHGMLRAEFSDNGQQRILPDRRQDPLTVHDLRSFDEDVVAQRLDELRDALSHARMDVANGEVFQVALSRLPGGTARLHVDVDMLAADALSYRVLLADLARFYDEPEYVPAPINYSYPRYLAERELSRKAEQEAAREWWQNRVSELPTAPDLPLVPESERADASRVTRRHHWLTPDHRKRLAARAHEHGLTPAMVVAAAFAETLSAWSAQPRFLMNLPMFDRQSDHPDVDKLVGDFTSSVLLEVDLSEEASFVTHARALQARMHEDAAHAAYSGVEVLRDLSRHHGEQVLAPIVFTSALNLGELFDARVRRCFGEAVWIVSQGPQVLLDAQVTEVNEGLLINWDVREHAFADGVIDAMFAAFRDLVTNLGQRDDVWERPAGGALPSSQLQVRASANATEGPRSGKLLHDGFFARAQETPDAPALLWGRDGVLTYGELADKALRIAGSLAAKGVKPGDLVGVSQRKGPEQVATAIGVLAAGAGYVPIGVDQPPARAERIQRIAGVEHVLTSWDSTAEPLASPVPVPAENIAYVLFTSGSTGEPKGVEVPHRAAMNTIDDLNERFGIGPADRCLAVSALEFDLSVYDVFGLLSVGGAVVLVEEDDRKEARQWVELAATRAATLVNCVPALLDMLLVTARPGELAGLRTVLLGGDWVGTDLPGRVFEQSPSCRFAGLGGTTETAIHSTVCEVREVAPSWRSVPYGTPLRNVACRVVDVRGRDCPDWVTGELWIGGDGVAHGYRADPERTADRFVTYEGRRWYRTGDLARYWPDGTLEFLGRRDHQVKVRGMRIELGEVEAALAEFPGVRRGVAGVAGTQLVAAVSGEVDGEKVREFVRTLLPPHMVPTRVVVLDAMPLTANGKVDRKVVAAHWAAETDTYVAPVSALEQVLAKIWAEVLGVERVGLDDAFFALGGDSVLATMIVGRLREALDTSEVTVRTLFATLSVGAMAARMQADESVPGRLGQVAEIYLEVDAMTEEELGL